MRITREGYFPSWSTGGPASGTVIEDPGGVVGGGPITLEEFIALFGAGTVGPFLRTTLGGLDIVQPLGTLGATETIDLANASVFWGTMDQNVTIGTTGWTDLRNATVIVELIEDGTGDWLPTFSGVTWVDGAPTAAAAGEVIQVVLRSRDGGTTIWGSVIGGAGSGGTPATTVTDETTFGIAPAVGTDTEYARQDHTHGSPSTDDIRDAGRWELAVIPGSPPDPLYADDDYLYLWVP